jgi:hypothetical protein
MSLLKEKNLKKSFTQRVREGAEVWVRSSKPRLRKRNRMIRAWASGYFNQGDKGSKAHTMNLVDRAIGILVPYLAMSNPIVHCEARVPQLKPWAYTTQLAMNHLLDEIKFSSSVMRPAVFNSMFGAGVVKTGVMKEWQSEVLGNSLDIGQPYAVVVDDEDYIGDVSANSRDNNEMEGNYYVMPTAMAKEFFGSRHADSICPSFKLHGDTSVTEIVKQNVRGTDYHTLRSWTRLMDVYLADEGVVITLLADGDYHKILRTTEYDGPEDGPYDFLGYKFAPKQSMPIPPAWGWIDMDTAMNVLINKMRQQAEREKNILAFQPEAQEDAEAMQQALDGGSCKVDDINAVKTFQMGGTNPENYNWVTYIEGQFSIQGGNLYQLGGRGSQAETLGQEQMMMTNASRIVDDMHNQVYDFTQSIFRKLAWYIWNDPMIEVPTVKRIEGAGDIEVIYDKYAQEGDFYDFNFKIQPYSMQRFNPSVQGQKLMQFLSAWVLPVMGIAQQQGVQLNIDAATTKIAEYLQLDIDDIWNSAVPKDGGQVGMGPYQPTQGQVKQKGKFGQTDDRFGASDASRQGNSMQFQASPRSGQPSPAQK